MQNKALSAPVIADVSRIAAGVTAAVATGALAQIIHLVIQYIAGPDRGMLEPMWLDSIVEMAVGAAVIGSPWSILIIVATRARLAPWKSLWILPLGMAIGYECISAPLSHASALESLSSVLGPLAFLAATVIGPLIGGFAASFLIRPSVRKE